MIKFSEILEGYLEERDRQNSDYYDNRYIGSRHDGQIRLDELAQKLDEMIQGVEE